MLIVLAAGLFAWIYLREMVRPGTRLILDREGLHLRRRPPETDFGGPWTDLYAARVDRDPEPPRVMVTFVHGQAEGVDERSPVSSTEIHLPKIIGQRPDALLAEIERFRRAYLRLSAQYVTHAPRFSS